MNYHDPYHFSSRTTYLLACRRWAADYAVLSASRREGKKTIRMLHRKGDIIACAIAQAAFWRERVEVHTMLAKRSSMKVEANRQVQEAWST